MKNKKYLSMAVALAVMAAGSSVFAADVADFGDEEVIVTATRTEKKDLDVPASTEVITAQQIQEMGARNAADALSKVNGFTFATMGNMNGSMATMTHNLTIRGNDNGTMVMVNGNPIVLRGKYDISTIPAENIERIEIVKGGSSVLYGSEAMAGIVNIITKDDSQSNIKVGIGNHGKKQVNFNINADKVKVRYNAMVWPNSNDVSTTELNNKNYVGKTHTYYSDAKRENLGFDYKVNDRFKVSYDFLRTYGTYYRNITDFTKNTLGAKLGEKFNSRDDIITQSLFQANYKDDLWQVKAFFNTALTESFGPNYYYQSSNKTTVNIVRTNGAYSDKNPYQYDTRERSTTYGIDVQRNWKLGEKAELISGVNYQREMYATYWTPYQVGTLKTTSKFSPSDYSRNIWAVFAQLDQKFDDKNSLIFGARETWTSGAITNYSNFSMSGQFLHKLNEENSLYLSIAQSFVMPTFAEMYRAGDQAEPNPDLKPQKGINYELGWKQNHGDHTWKVAAFYAHIKDNITSTYDKTMKKFTYSNDEYKNMGVELEYNYAPEGKFAYNWGFTYMNPLNRGEGEKAKKTYWDRKFGRIQITGGITYKVGKFTTNFNASYLADRVMCPSSEHSYPTKPYLLTSMNFLYSPDKNSDISLEIENVLSRRDNVMHTSSDYYTAPANFMLSYNYKF